MEDKHKINLLNTSFSMKANLSIKELLILKSWQDNNIYARGLEQRQANPKFIIHDGPPYANGKIHIGHAVNKILKDFIIRHKTMSGYYSPYIPGWDCHGLPIEIQIEKKHGIGLSKAEVFKLCRAYAKAQIEDQKASFIRLGILGDWDYPYKTMDYNLEANEILALAEIYKSGLLRVGMRPVNWCLQCSSSLSDAEVEYKNKTSTSIDLGFLVSNKEVLFSNISANILLVIWTTTPWTIPANQAIAVNPNSLYSLISCIKGYLIIAKDLVASSLSRYGVDKYELIKDLAGTDLLNLTYIHPITNKVLKVVQGSHVSMDEGTGLVHTAPSHGFEDYLLAKELDICIETPILCNGRYAEDYPLVGSKKLLEAEAILLKYFEELNLLICSNTINHSYPHCWRHGKPIIFMATPQWFIELDKKSGSKSLRESALDAIESDISFSPEYGRSRLRAMVYNRNNWCISRQRKWGVPMAMVLNKEDGTPHPNSYAIFKKVADKVRLEGIEAWDKIELAELISEDLDLYTKSKDSLDVWIDSGLTHITVSDRYKDIDQFDLYVEGSDQHRGWFQSSLLTSEIIKSKPPYKALLTHGFVVDSHGRKMSKSVGNTVDPMSVVNKYGADVLRLWVASVDYSQDMACSMDGFKPVIEIYRRLRNTIRFMLANLSDFIYEKHKSNELLDLDSYILIKTEALEEECLALYESYSFHLIVKKIYIFCSESLGRFYIDILKDRLYTMHLESSARRSAQNALYHILNVLLRLLSPIIPFTSDEAWRVFIDDDKDSLYLNKRYKLPVIHNKHRVYWKLIEELIPKINKQIESSKEHIQLSSSLQVSLVLSIPSEQYYLLKAYEHELKFVFMVSEFKLILGDKLNILVSRLDDNLKCDRCWHYVAKTNDICDRCKINISSSGEHRTFA